MFVINIRESFRFDLLCRTLDHRRISAEIEFSPPWESHLVEIHPSCDMVSVILLKSRAEDVGLHSMDRFHLLLIEHIRLVTDSEEQGGFSALQVPQHHDDRGQARSCCQEYLVTAVIPQDEISSDSSEENLLSRQKCFEDLPSSSAF